MIPREKIEEIMQTARIEEVVGDFVSLRKRGANMWGNCPFHNEKTPSFSVNPARNIFKCFGCGKAGNSVTFLMEHEHFTYQEALRYLAKKYRITIEEQELTPEQITERSKRESMFNLSNFAQTYFVDNLWNTDEGKSIGLSYFRERGYFDPIIERFGLGYSPQQWEAFSKYAIENGYNKDLLVELGLSIEGKQGPYDRFHGRVMFPVHDVSGRVIGFGGRILSNKDKKDPKYQNSPESEIYDKKKTLYGIYFAKNAIIKADECILVEGYFDVLRMHQSGIENVVASSGTSLTEEQIKLINRYTKNITILYDGDAAGQKASLRGTDMILAAGMNVRVVSLPPEHDPDTFAKDYPIEEVQRYLKDNARNFIRFKTELLMHDAANDPIKRAEAIRDIVQSISVIPDPIFRSTYVRECSTLLNIKEEILVGELNKILVKDFRKKLGIEQNVLPDEPANTTLQQQEEQIDEGNKALLVQEQELVRMMLAYGQNMVSEEVADGEGNFEVDEYSLAVYIIDDLKSDGIAFEDPVCKKIFDIYDKEIDNGNVPADSFFVANEDAEISQLAATLLSTPYKLDNWSKHGIEIKQEADNLKASAMSSLVRYKELVLTGRRRLLEKELVSADQDDQLIIMKQIKDIDDARMRLNKYTGTVVTR